MKRSRTEARDGDHAAGGGEGDGVARGRSKGGKSKKREQQRPDFNTKRKRSAETPAVANREIADVGPSKAKWSKSKKKRMRRHKTNHVDEDHNDQRSAPRRPHPKESISLPERSRKEIPKEVNQENPCGNVPFVASRQTLKPASKLQQLYMDRLVGSRFRVLNEELYTVSSQVAFAKFQATPSLYDEYHIGYREQVKSWPVNPVDIVFGKVMELQQKRKSTDLPVSPIVVADFGCGDAALGQKLLQVSDSTMERPCFQVHNFDLVDATASLTDTSESREPRPEVTACDMARTPLPDHCLDIGVFCLSLMGTNIADFIREAYRVLKPNGWLFVVEVQSRFSATAPSAASKQIKSKETNSKDREGRKEGLRSVDDGSSLEGTDLRTFVKTLERIGFKCMKEDTSSNKMFVFLDLTKRSHHDHQIPSDPTIQYTAKPCVYKRR
jgi:ribosomal RNA-processing protein 8